MSRTFPISRSLKALSLLTALATLCLAALPHAARAGAYTYGTTSQRTVNAGILLLSGNPTPTTSNSPAGLAASPDNKDPYVFYILNQRTDIKPFGWNIVNPHAPSAVTPDIQLRWDQRTGQASGSHVYPLGQTVSPAMAAYWEVPLSSTSSDDLAQYDVLFLNLESQVSFTAADAEKLRRFVDGGGTLWIEDSGTGGGVNSSDLPFFSLQYNSGTASYATVSLINRHPLISTPFLLSTAEINSLGGRSPGTYFASLTGASTAPPQYTSTVIGDSAGKAVAAAGAYGAGQIVVTSTGSANIINEYAGTTALDIAGVGANSGPFCAPAIQNAPTADLKLLANICNLASTHQNEHQNSRQTGDDPGAIPSAQHTWTATMASLTSGAATGSSYAGVAVYGHMAFTTDSAGKLHAFDLYPAENLDNNATGNPDQGLADFNNGAPWDEIWATVALGAGSSAPTVAVDAASGNVYVLVEDAKGGVSRFTVGGPGVNINTTPTATLLTNSSGRGAYSTSTVPMSAPAPTYFDGRVFAGGADGTLFVGTLTNAPGNTGSFQVNPVAPSGTGATVAVTVVAPPTVGIVPDAKGANDILALVTTNTGLYSIFLGSRGEPLTANGTTGAYNTKLTSLTNARMDATAGQYRVYTLDPSGYPLVQTATASPIAPNFSITLSGNGPPPALFADYDADLSTSTGVNPEGPLTRTVIGVAGEQATTSPTSYVSAPALDRFGNVYYTVTTLANGAAPLDSVLYCVHDAPGSGAAHVNWRFRLPQSTAEALTDADNTSYTSLAGMQFTTAAGGAAYPSAPVVDEQGNVYVLATGAGGTAVLCFNGLGTVSADLLSSGDQSNVSNVAITQPINGSDEFGSSSPANVNGNQYQISGGTINFTNFAAQSYTAAAAGAHVLYPDLSEPYPITVSFNIGAPPGTPPTDNASDAQTTATVPLHTNLTWYTVRPGTVATSGLTKVGNTLYFVDGANIYSVPADVQTEGFTITNKYIDPTLVGTTGQPLFTPQSDDSIGATAAVPASAGGALLVSGPNGLSAFTNQVTLVVDSNRVVEMDGAGNAQWAVDSTTETTLAGGTAPVYTGNGTPGTGQLVTTTLELNRPSSVYELAQNDYLVADTGNNRCVRFDRAGKVIWELTKFSDATLPPFKPSALLKPGEPDTLNQPTSVQVQSRSDAAGDTIVQYLIADNGNFRVLEVDDVYNSHQVLVGYHLLRWISHTHDVQGREYRYQTANYYEAPSGKIYVAALIANKRLAPFTYKFSATPASANDYGSVAQSLLAPANQDANGGSIVLLDYDPDNNITVVSSKTAQIGFGANNQADGFVGTSIDTNTNIATPITVNSFYADLNGQNFNIDKATQAVSTANGMPPAVTTTATPLLIRNPRYLKVYATQVKNNTVRHYLLADDNGAYDLTPGTLGGRTVFYAQWGFTQADYHNVTTPISQEGVTGVVGTSSTVQVPFLRSSLPFIASSIQLTGTDVVNSYPVGRYLVTNSFSQGEAANAVGPYNNVNVTPVVGVQPGFSGEAMEIQTLSNGTNLVLNEVHDNQYNVNNSLLIPLPMNGVSRFIGHTLSRPASSNTSPLNQPTFAFRLQF